jgi:outer membrane protein assembly factor BamB
MPALSNLNETSSGDKIYALNKATGTIVWNHTTGGGVWSSPAVSSNSVYVGSGDGKLYVLNALTGAVQWSYQTNGAIYSSPAIDSNAAYVGSSDGTVYAIGLPSQATNSSTNSSFWIIIVIAVIVTCLAVMAILLIVRKRTKTRLGYLKTLIASFCLQPSLKRR